MDNVNNENLEVNKGKTPLNIGIDDEFDDLIDTDSLSFRPITKGLGFHREDEKTKHPIQRKKIASTRDFVLDEKKALNSMASQAAAQLREQKAKTHFQHDKLETADIKRSPEFSEIYGKKEVEVSVDSRPIQNEAPIETIKDASGFIQFLAWIFDCVVVTSVIFGLLVFSRLIGSYNLKEFYSLENYGNLILLYAIYCVFYVIYFSISEAVGGQSFGKRLFGLRLVSDDNEELKFSQTFKRALISVFSPPLLGIPSLKSIINPATQTKVIKKK